MLPFVFWKRLPQPMEKGWEPMVLLKVQGIILLHRQQIKNWLWKPLAILSKSWFCMPHPLGLVPAGLGGPLTAVVLQRP